MSVKVLMGVGNRLRRDDGVGAYIAEKFRCDGWISINCGQSPENYITKVEEIDPLLIVIVDAAKMGLKPGEYRIIPPEKIDNFALSTHNIPLSIIIRYLGEHRCKLIGIEPKSIEFGNRLSRVVKKSAEEIIKILCVTDICSIPSL